MDHPSLRIMKRSILIGLLALATPLTAVPVFIGTSTGGNSASKGIYLADFDPETGKLTEPKLAAEYQNPGFLAQHPVKPILYACGAPRKPAGDGAGSVAAFTIGADHSLTFLAEISSGGQNPCHVAVDATGNTVAVANYGDGLIKTIKLGTDGTFAGTGTFLMESGGGPHARQKGSHAHGVYFDRSNRFLFVPDLGADRVRVLRFKAAGSTFLPADEDLETAAGAGPRHMAFSPDEKQLYVINELDCTILAASYDGEGGFKPIHTVKTLPEGYSGANTTAEIEVSADGRFVYASNRGHDSIAVFARDARTGKLTALQHAPCGGKTPRHFKIAPGGKWLLCGHQGSDTISVLPRDPKHGTLGAAMRTVSAPSPICIHFAR